MKQSTWLTVEVVWQKTNTNGNKLNSGGYLIVASFIIGVKITMIKKKYKYGKDIQCDVGLMRENKILKEMLKKCKEKNRILEETVESMKIDEAKRSEEMRDIKAKYLEVIKECEETKKSYAKKMEEVYKQAKKDLKK